MLRRLLLLATAAALGAGPLSAQAQSSPSRPAPDQRVRVNLVDGSGMVEGRVIGWTGDTLILAGPILNGTMLDVPVRIARARIASYQLGLGRDYERGIIRGVKTGALVGGGVGLVLLGIGVAASTSCGDCFIPPAVVGAVLGLGATVGGIVLGAALGTMTAPELWGEPQRVAAGDGAPWRHARFAVTFSLARRR